MLKFRKSNNIGEAIDYALFNREIKIDEHLGLDITFQMANFNGDHSIAAIPNSVEQIVLTGDDTYQIVLTHCISGNVRMIIDGMLLDLNTINTINFDNDWWNKVYKCRYGNL